MYFPYLFIYLYIFTLIPKLQATNISRKFRSYNKKQHTILIEESNKSKILYQNINNKKHLRNTKSESFITNFEQPSIDKTSNPKMLRSIQYLNMDTIKLNFPNTTNINILPEISTYKKNTTKKSCKNQDCHLYQILDNGTIQSIQVLPPPLTLLNTTNKKVIKRALRINNISTSIYDKKI
ncbi:uncharacterized protein CMU_033200 [Cryptosporidium muris RN66]|uniref:Uncharacterized protein n=1 Tax=Cryptosporidium muris (strain RN66) TaxID=441375 RepID=B6AFE4_CRYMR|nr:uncharacterized protein CMU_033200 [Cryptosporidium muris RN66]EEA06935.1 hypothetical protein CMU_033200 [Cryptosporidium muris RN66]|eukprot:XP_002141284.1 hypothetical protein [Cryptosporidium muris RN66]